ncbi:NAD(P)-dependent oxidoreductase [Variovorax sp. GT1P44]|uniref:NAD(P)-dependent oxidoreductase n=1 Tax=Variovorax sp. GT1P44 TaxID=3443742 RepID=UPI003F48FFAE
MTIVFVSHPADKLDQYFGARAVKALTAIAEARFNPHARELPTRELIAAAEGCDAIIAYRQTPAPEAVFRDLPDLAAFLRCAVDIRTIDVAAASAHGVLVTQASAGYVPAVAEWIVAAMIDLGRGISRYADAYHRGEPPTPFMGRELRGSTLGVIGYGQIAQYLCKLATALGMNVQVATPELINRQDGLQQVPMQTLLAASDFVVCLAPANAQTENLMDATAFAAMRADAFFINASRGELVDEGALLHALESGHIAGCALDVGRAPDQMPTPSLAAHPRVLATPHIGGLTAPATEHQAMETVSQLARLQKGEVPAGAINAANATRLAAWRRRDLAASSATSK